MADRITSTYEHSLQGIYYEIANRGIAVDLKMLERAKAIVASEITRHLAIASAQWGCKVFIGADNAPKQDELNFAAGAVNLNATQGKYALLQKLKDLGYDVPKVTKKNSDGDYESDYSTGELALQKMLARNQFNHPGGDPAIKSVLRIRELGKLNSAYLNAELYKRGELAFFLSNYNVAGTLTGRRSSRRHTFGYGANGQNFPSHSDIAALFRRCLVARPGNVFLFVDQVQAEDWPVSALSGNLTALQELRSGVDRHSKLASALFGIPVPPKGDPTWNKSVHDFPRYMGKKTRHASNYDMTAGRMADALAQEGKAFTQAQCEVLLARIRKLDPSVAEVFHKYVKDTLSATRVLTTPFGRERQFLGLRPADTNSTLFKEAYAFIPQSTVGDNTGFAVAYLEGGASGLAPERRAIVQEGHDSIAQDIPADVETIYRYLLLTQAAFNRKIRFHNGIEVQIPIEAELGFNFKTTVSIKGITRQAVKDALEKLRELAEKEALEEAA